MTILQNDISRKMANFADEIERDMQSLPPQYKAEITGIIFDLREKAKILCSCEEFKQMHPGWREQAER